MSERRRRYLTTPIYYASGEPHLGHAYTTILADVLARFDRQNGADVFYLTGTDEHGQKIQEEAARRGVEPIELCDEMAERFEAAWQTLEISHDRFIRTTEAEHIAVVQAFLQRLWDRGEIFEDVYSGWYCVHEERYWTEKDLGPDQGCPDCGRPTSHVEEKNYFFRMSAYQEALIRQIEENPEWIVPEIRRNEVLGFLQWHRLLAPAAEAFHETLTKPVRAKRKQQQREAGAAHAGLRPGEVTARAREKTVNIDEALGAGAVE